MATQKELKVVLSAEDKASAVLNDFNNKTKEIGKNFLVVGGLITGAMGYAVKSASDAEEQMAKFNNTLDTMGALGNSARSSLLEAGDATLKLGFDNEEASVSLAKLFQRTKSVEEATKLNTLAMDLARNKNIDLSTASNMVGMVMSGNAKILKQYGIDIKDTATPLEALDELQKKVGGSATAYAETLKGQTEILKNQFGELTEEIGGQLLPMVKSIVKSITPVVEAVVKWTRENPQLTKTIIAIIAGIGLLVLGLGALSLAITAMIPILGTFGVALVASTGGLILVASALAFLATAISEKLTQPYDDAIKKNNEFAQRSGELADKLKSLRIPIEANGEKMKDFAEKMEKATKAVADASENLNKTLKKGAEDLATFNQDKAKLFVEQEATVAKLREEIQTKSAENAKAIALSESFERISQNQKELNALNVKLTTEQLALETSKDQTLGIEKEIADAKRFSKLTDFEQHLETLNKKRLAEIADLAEKVKHDKNVLAQAVKAKNELIALEQEYTANIAKEEAKRLADYVSTTAQIKATLAERAQVQAQVQATSSFGGFFSNNVIIQGAKKLSGFATGGEVSGNNPIIVGEAGAEVFVPNQSGTIIPNNKLGGNNGGITVNINGGTYLSESVANDIGNMIVRRLQMVSKISA